MGGGSRGWYIPIPKQVYQLIIGRSCIKVNRNFIKGYFRLAVALRSAGKYKEAIDNIKMGLAVDPGNSDLKKQASEMEELVRKDRVLVLISKAKEQMQAGDLKDCLTTCDRALALDAGNAEVVRIKKSVEPKFQAAEKRRIESLPKAARDKERGDKCYRDANFEGAIEAYTKCIDATSDKASDVCLKAYSNRSACYKQLSNFDGTIADCTAVLDTDPNNNLEVYIIVAANVVIFPFGSLLAFAASKSSASVKIYPSKFTICDNTAVASKVVIWPSLSTSPLDLVIIYNYYTYNNQSSKIKLNFSIFNKSI